MNRAFLIVLDSVGCGGAPDAAEFGDEGANTLGHIAQTCATGQADEGRQGPLAVPHLASLGLWQAVELASGVKIAHDPAAAYTLWGAATEHSPGKDTPTGHWELAGVPVPWDWHYFPNTQPCFPEELVALVMRLSGTSGILGNRHAPGTAIIETCGPGHVKTGWPICYTSVDSVFQIAAHETHFGLERLYALCEALAPHLHQMKVGRVIARPFLGDQTSGYIRTSNRRDYAMALPSSGLCDWASAAERKVLSIGKISDIFSGSGISRAVKGDDAQLMQQLARAVDEMAPGSLTFANFVEFDSLYGHRRDVAGYARHLEWFDRQIGPILARLKPGDMMLFTADHGNDPTWHGTDHTRERVPVVLKRLAGHEGEGVLKTAQAKTAGAKGFGHVNFVDVAASIAQHLGLPDQPCSRGESFL